MTTETTIDQPNKTELTYVAVWPILDHTRPIGALIAEACQELDIKAQLAGARIIDTPTWDLSLDQQSLVCHAPARAFDPDAEDDRRVSVTAEQRAHIQRLATNGLSNRQIAEMADVSPTTVRRYARQVR